MCIRDSIKAEAFCKASGLPTVADDSGLCVDALGGAPGVYSARYAGRHGDDDANNTKLLREMEEIPTGQRTARFVSAVCFMPVSYTHLDVYKRQALATRMPGAKQDFLLLDCGANAECRAEMLNAFGTCLLYTSRPAAARLDQAYAQHDAGHTVEHQQVCAGPRGALLKM